MYFFTSDTHFNDDDTLLVDNRPFKSAKHFDNFVIKTWNKQARKKDTIFVIGDFVDCDGPDRDNWKKSILYVQQIKANVVLIIGNNEERVIKNWFNNNFEEFRKYCLSIGFKEVYTNHIIEVCNRKFFLTHQPKFRRPDMLSLFGHTHRSCGLYKPYGFNIGCDLNHFYLFTEKDIQKFLDMKARYWDKDENLHNW